MTPGLATAVGALAGLGLGVGVLLVGLALADARRTPIEVRVLPYLRDLPRPANLPAPVTAGTGREGAP